MKNKKQCMLADLTLALKKARDNADDLDGRKSVVKDLRTDLFAALDILNKVQGLLEQDNPSVKNAMATRILNNILDSVDLCNKLCRLEEIDEEKGGKK